MQYNYWYSVNLGTTFADKIKHNWKIAQPPKPQSYRTHVSGVLSLSPRTTLCDSFRNAPCSKLKERVHMLWQCRRKWLDSALPHILNEQEGFAQNIKHPSSGNAEQPRHITLLLEDTVKKKKITGRSSSTIHQANNSWTDELKSKDPHPFFLLACFCSSVQARAWFKGNVLHGNNLHSHWISHLECYFSPQEAAFQDIPPSPCPARFQEQPPPCIHSTQYWVREQEDDNI